MISYFKYTEGNAFTLDGIPYVGYFTIDNGKAYTGKTVDDDSQELTATPTFIADFFLNKFDFDNQPGSVEGITPEYSNVFDIFNKQEFDKLLNTINRNNLIVFKSLVTRNQQIANFSDTGSHFYGLSSSEVDMRNDDVPYGKKVYTQIDPFAFKSEWEFLDRIITGTVLPSLTEDFLYVCSTGSDVIVLEGSFTNTVPIQVLSRTEIPDPRKVVHIYYDENDSKLVILENSQILIYDASLFKECNNLILVDSINLGDINNNLVKWDVHETFDQYKGKIGSQFLFSDENNPEHMKFGYNYRVSVNENILYIVNKYSREIINSFDLTKYGITNVYDVAIRNVDDYIAILHGTSDINLTLFDPSDITTITHTKLEDLLVTSYYTVPNYRIDFSNFDSNVIYTISRKEVQTRALTNPSYPIGKTNNENLKYLRTYTFSNTYQKFGDCNLKWNSNTLPSNIFNNIVFNSTSNGGKMYLLIHNIGRLYSIKQNIFDSYYSAINMGTEKYYNGIFCSESSIGLYLNNSISKVLRDTLVLYNQAINSFTLTTTETVFKEIEELSFEIDNLYLNGNETINVISIQRILTLLTQLQTQIIS